MQFEGSYGHGSGLGPSEVDLSDPARSLVMVADELQEAVMDARFTAWPACPRHHFVAVSSQVFGRGLDLRGRAPGGVPAPHGIWLAIS